MSQRKNSLRNTIKKIDSDPKKRNILFMKSFSPTINNLIEQQEENEQDILESSMSSIDRNNYKIKVMPFDIRTNSIVSRNRLVSFKK